MTLSCERDLEDFLRSKSKNPLRTMLERSPLPAKVLESRQYQADSELLTEALSFGSEYIIRTVFDRQHS